MQYKSGETMSNFDTRAVHAGRADLRELGVHAPPLDMSTTYPVGDLDGAADQLDAWAAGEQPAGSPVYARLHNPTVARFEEAMAELEGAAAAVAFASGMGAITAILLALAPDRRHVVAVRPLYGGTDHLLCGDLLAIDVTWAEPHEVREALRPNTGLIVLETPQNPTSTLVDIAAVARQAGDVPVLVDNTFATPVLQQPITLGASLVVHSATKFIGGHGDVMGGVVACDEAFAKRLRYVRIATGAVLHPMAAYQLHRGLATLPIRVRAMQRTATELAARIAAHRAVGVVYHASLAATDPDRLVGRQMSGPGSMIAFELNGGFAAARTLLGSLNLMTHAVSLGSTDTLIQHPASLTHRVVDAGCRDESGVNQSLVRISVGLEHVDDLWADLVQALDAIDVIDGIDAIHPIDATTDDAVDAVVAMAVAQELVMPMHSTRDAVTSVARAAGRPRRSATAR
ncbi:MAG: aminotransferase class I/II-fold pyridoxal phosphate-dependent enzyme [Thermoleophilia bacterium]|nr:aminotransferase class I/II-fold pyridoxal phosphate-dependent enzyme [Thermoleophilia bacterium]